LIVTDYAKMSHNARFRSGRKAVTTASAVLVGLVVIMAGVAGYFVISPRVETNTQTTTVTTAQTATVTSAQTFTVTTSKVSTAAASILCSPKECPFQNIGQPFNATELAMINSQPLSYYEKAGEMLLNGTIANKMITGAAKPYQPFVVNGKPSVIWEESLSCQGCAIARWPQALALAAFGNFTGLYKGYSSLGDNHVTTIYWSTDNYTTSEGSTYASQYTSKYLNLYAMAYDTPIINGVFRWTTLDYFVQHAPNATWQAAAKYMANASVALGKQAPGPPVQLWGGFWWFGINAIILGNSTSFSGFAAPVTNLDHDSALKQISTFNGQYAWSNYAAADLYVAAMCPAIHNAAPVCSLPVIAELASKL